MPGRGKRVTMLLIIDVQNDFFEPGGSLGVKGADDIVPVINGLRQFNFDMVVQAVDWHPYNHCSFSSNNPGAAKFSTISLPLAGPQTMWPDHCIQDTFGSAFHKDLVVKATDIIVRAGINPHSDSYSAFRDNIGQVKTPLLDIMLGEGVTHLFCVGLALDYCVQYTALDAKMQTDAEVYVVDDGCRPLYERGRLDAYTKFDQERVHVIMSHDPQIRQLGEVKIPTQVPLAKSPQKMRNQFLLRAVVALDVNATNIALGTLRADRTYQPMPSGMNPLHVILAYVPQNAAELTKIIQITKMLLLHSPSGYIDRATSSRCPRSGGVTPLMLVVQNRRLELARVLLAMRPDMKLRETEEHLTVLMLAARSGDAELVRLLMENGAAKTLRYRSKFNKNALMYACCAVGLPRVTSMTERRKALINKSTRKPTRASSDAFSDGDSVSSLDTFAHSEDSDDTEAKEAAMSSSVAQAGRVVKALVDSLEPKAFLELLNHKDADGWTALHFAAKSGVLPFIPWRKLLGDELIRKVQVSAMTLSDLSVLHLAAWNGQAGALRSVLVRMRGYPGEYTPWHRKVARNAPAGEQRHTAVDLALECRDFASASMLFGVGCNARVQAGDLCNEALERALLQFNASAMETLIRSSSNKVTWELHAIQLVQLVKYENACTFTFSGYNNPIRQHLYHCNECDKDVCLVCATHCHTHEECDDPKPLKRLGFQDQAVWCACPRHSCLCVPPEEARLYQFLPHPVDTSKVTLGIKGTEISSIFHGRPSHAGSRLSWGARTHLSVSRRRSNAKRFRRVAQDAHNAHKLGTGASSSSVLSSKSGVSNPTETSDEKASRKAAIKGIFGEKQLSSLPPVLVKLVNIMAKHFHAVWAMGKATSGWRYGQTRDDEALVHPLLKPFSKLTPEAQADNRMAALKQIKLIKAVGYTIHLPDASSADATFPLDSVKTWVSLGSLNLMEGDLGQADLALIQLLSKDRIDTSSATLDDSHFQLVELCARNSHEEWSLQQMQRGYVYGPGPKVSTPREGEGPAVQKTNNLLVPFELLPPDYQSSNRSAAEEMVKLLVKLGARVLPEVSGARKVAQNMEQLRNVQADRIREQQSRREDLRRRFWTVTLLRAARDGNSAWIQAVMSVKSSKPVPEINCASKVLRQTPLYLAAKHGHVQAVRVLITLGASLEARDCQGLTALAAAAFCGQTNTCHKLVRFGADPTTIDNYGFTPLHHACYNGMTSTAAVFVRQLTRLKDSGRLVDLSHVTNAVGTGLTKHAMQSLFAPAKNTVAAVDMQVAAVHGQGDRAILQKVRHITTPRSSRAPSLAAPGSGRRSPSVPPPVTTHHRRTNRAVHSGAGAGAGAGAGSQTPTPLTPIAGSSPSMLRGRHSPSSTGASPHSRTGGGLFLGVSKRTIQIAPEAGFTADELLAAELVKAGPKNLARVMRHLTEEDREDLTIGPKHLERVTDTRDDLHAPRAWAERIGSLCCCRRGHSQAGPHKPDDAATLDGGPTRYSALSLAVKARRLDVVAVLLSFDADPTLPDAMGISPYDRALKDHAGVQLHKEELLIALTEQNRKLNESLLREQLAARAVNQARSRQLVQAPGTNTTGSTSKVNGFTATVINPFASVSRRIGRPSIFMQRKGSGGSGRTEQTGSQSSLRDVTTGDSTRSMFQQASDQKLMAASNDMSLAAAVRLRMEDHSNATMEARKREVALKRYARRERDLTTMLNLLNKSPHTQSLRRTFAYGEVFMGMVMFLLFFLALAYVSPFAPDFNMVAMFRKSNSLEEQFGKSWSSVGTRDELWQWTTGRLGGLGGTAASAAAILQNRSDGTIGVFGESLVGPIRLQTMRLVPHDAQVLSADGARYVFAVDSKSCDVEEAFRPVLGACGGAGVKVETVASGTIDNGKLVRVMRQYTLGGWLSDVQATLASMDVDTVLPMDTDNVEVHMSLYAPDGDLFVGVKLLASLADGGAAPGSVSASTEVNSVRLFHWRFPPSLAFEVVVGTIIASQILMTVWRMVSSPFSVLEFLRRERSLYDVTLLALFVWLLVKDILLRVKADSAKEAIRALAATPIAGVAIANRGTPMGMGHDFVDVGDIAEDYRALKDLLAIVIVFSCLRVMKYMQMLPALGPMLVAVMATIYNNAVLLYLSLLAGTLCVFSVAFHVAVGAEAPNFVSVPNSIMALTEWMVGEVGSGYLDESPQRPALSVLFVGFILFMSIVLVNLFIGVVTDLYPTAKRNSEQDWDALITGLMQQRFTAIMLNDRQRSHNQLFGLNDGGEDGDSGEGGEGQGSGSGKGSGRSVVSARDGAHGGKRSPKSGTPVLPTPATKPPAGKVSPYAAGQDSKAAPKLMSRVASSRSLKNIKSIKVSPSPTNGASPMLRESSKQRVLKLKLEAAEQAPAVAVRSAESPERGPRRTSWGADDFKASESFHASMRHILDRMHSDDSIALAGVQPIQRPAGRTMSNAAAPRALVPPFVALDDVDSADSSDSDDEPETPFVSGDASSPAITAPNTARSRRQSVVADRKRSSHAQANMLSRLVHQDSRRRTSSQRDLGVRSEYDLEQLIDPRFIDAGSDVPSHRRRLGNSRYW